MMSLCLSTFVLHVYACLCFPFIFFLPPLLPNTFCSLSFRSSLPLLLSLPSPSLSLFHFLCHHSSLSLTFLFCNKRGKRKPIPFAFQLLESEQIPKQITYTVCGIKSLVAGEGNGKTRLPCSRLIV